jgi:hypothetical protein
MKRFVLWIILVVLFGLAGTTYSTSDKAFVRIKTSSDELDLGTAIFFDGIHEVQGALKVEVEANCWHGPILISTTPLKRTMGGIIKPEDIFVRTSRGGHYVPLHKPVVILPTALGSEDVVLDFKVHGDLSKPSGSYKGVVTLTIVPPV